MISPRRIVIAGGGAAGLAVAESARTAGFTGDLVMVTRERHLPYDRPPLSKQVLAGTWDAGRVQLRDETRLRSLGLEIRTDAAATGLDTAASELVLEDGDSLPYDRLVIATGLDPIRLRGTEAFQNVHVLRDLDQALRLRDALCPGSRLVVIGAGVLGSEVAAVACRLGVSVTLVDEAARPLSRVVAPAIGDWVAALHEENGVKLQLGRSVKSVKSSVGGTADGKADVVELDDGRRLPADVILIAIGARPSNGWLAGTAVPVGEPGEDEGAGGVLCAVGGRAAGNVYAAGDVAAWWSPRAERYVRLEHRLSATEQGRAVALAILDPAAPVDEKLPYFWSDHYDLKLQCFGLAARTDEFHVVEGSLTSRAFIGVSTRDGLTTAVVGSGMQRRLNAWRHQIGLPLTVPA